MPKGKKVRVAAVQTAVSENLDQNLAHTIKKIRRAAKRGAQIVALQELFRTPYFPQKRNIDVNKFSESVPGKTTKAMSALAKELGVAIIVPLCEKQRGGKTFNTVVVFDENGKLAGKYHKIHIPHDPGFYEKDYFEAGDLGYVVFKTRLAKFAVLICYDQWFPEAARSARLSGAEIIFYPTAIGNIIGYLPPEGDWHEAWETIQRSHAVANSVPIVSINRTGKEGKTQFWGQSFICDAFGKVIKRAGKTSEEVLVATLDLGMNQFISEGWGFLRNRRPETYTSLISKKLVSKSKKLKNVSHYKDTQRALKAK